MWSMKCLVCQPHCEVGHVSTVSLWLRYLITPGSCPGPTARPPKINLIGEHVIDNTHIKQIKSFRNINMFALKKVHYVKMNLPLRFLELKIILVLFREQGSSKNDGRSDVYDRSELLVISSCCYTNCCYPICCHTKCGNFTWIYWNLSGFP